VYNPMPPPAESQSKPVPTQATNSEPTVQDNLVTTEQVITIEGGELRYIAIAGTLAMKDEAGKPKASIFFIAYLKQGVTDATRRPLTFSFNGGPGSSSIWLHLGLLGPRRVLSGDTDQVMPPPYRLADNEHTLLATSDLVFIDPVSTGYSRAAQGEEAKQFHGLEKDMESVGEFIRLFVTRYKRWLSPKFLIGESYGTTRAAALAGHLQERHGLYLNGIMLVSSVLDFSTILFNPGHDLPHLLYLPSFAATAWYHGKSDPAYRGDLPRLLREVEAFALGDYALALLQGAALDPAERARIVERLALYTGLTPAYIEQTNLRIEIMRFCKELLREGRRTVGRLDSRFQGIDRDAAGEQPERDPSYSAILGPYAGAFNAYIREELGFVSDLPYEVLTSLYETWDYGKHQNKFVNVAESLRTATAQNPHLQVLVANGYFDLATPYFATEYTFNHLELDPPLRDNIQMTYYEAGHMMYVHEPSLAQLGRDLAGFVERVGQDAILPYRRV
jgi:carboxypeptidase C (cathepsin A)